MWARAAKESMVNIWELDGENDDDRKESEDYDKKFKIQVHVFLRADFSSVAFWIPAESRLVKFAHRKLKDESPDQSTSYSFGEALEECFSFMF